MDLLDNVKNRKGVLKDEVISNNLRLENVYRLTSDDFLCCEFFRTPKGKEMCCLGGDNRVTFFDLKEDGKMIKKVTFPQYSWNIWSLAVIFNDAVGSFVFGEISCMLFSINITSEDPNNWTTKKYKNVTTTTGVHDYILEVMGTTIASFSGKQITFYNVLTKEIHKLTTEKPINRLCYWRKREELLYFSKNFIIFYDLKSRKVVKEVQIYETEVENKKNNSNDSDEDSDDDYNGSQINKIKVYELNGIEFMFLCYENAIHLFHYGTNKLIRAFSVDMFKDFKISDTITMILVGNELMFISPFTWGDDAIGSFNINEEEEVSIEKKKKQLTHHKSGGLVKLMKNERNQFEKERVFVCSKEGEKFCYVYKNLKLRSFDEEKDQMERIEYLLDLDNLEELSSQRIQIKTTIFDGYAPIFLMM